ncbi:serine protease inhibitor 3/4-like isoform X2 [Zophobas morio]|uniref:serine protease inhibitor 3/4-like isoform X2 n=1 Tax=Zophobas morio TaxID=2755281 RepID=UPI003082BD2C
MSCFLSVQFNIKNLLVFFICDRKMKYLIILTFTLSLAMANEVALQEFTTGNNLFTAAVYKEVLKENEGNFLISPFSIQTVLALTQSGAKDETALEIRNSLHLPNTTKSTEAIYSIILPKFKGNEQYALHTANKIYVKNSYPLKEEFKTIAANVYQAAIESIDFAQKDESANTINSWVEKQTENKIHGLIDPKNLDEETRVILINALYFKGKWTTPFETFATSKKDFYKTAKEVVQVDTMHNTDLYNYYESAELNAKFLELPYQGNDVSMVIVLPNEKEGLSSLENEIEKVFTAPRFTHERVSVSLPKFAVENKVQLKTLLENLGIKTAFSENADLSGLAGKKGELVISDVIQKAFINVTETGTEAAAATAVQAVRLSIAHPINADYKIFVADHPFIYYIAFKNVVLFEGRFSDPNLK